MALIIHPDTRAQNTAWGSIYLPDWLLESVSAKSKTLEPQRTVVSAGVTINSE